VANDGQELTPPATEGKLSDGVSRVQSDTTSSGETETEPELPELPPSDVADPAIRKARSDSSYSNASTTPTDGMVFSKAGKKSYSKRTKSISMHDLTHRFFRKPVVVLWRLDLFR